MSECVHCCEDANCWCENCSIALCDECFDAHDDAKEMEDSDQGDESE